MATKVILGSVSFDLAPRRKLKFDNPRVIANIDIPGAAPHHQDMGEGETTLSWEGILAGDTAYKAALQIEGLKDAGQAVQLVISDFPELSKKVRIKSFPWEVVREDRIEYSIELVAESGLVSSLAGTTSLVVTQGQEQETAPVGKEYVIKQGDTLWALAAANYGSGTQWRKIAQANGITDPTKLQIGQTITIPN